MILVQRTEIGEFSGKLIRCRDYSEIGDFSDNIVPYDDDDDGRRGVRGKTMGMRREKEILKDDFFKSILHLTLLQILCVLTVLKNATGDEKE
ncbi:hypothetical protein L6452_02905 [Arctium lappa]|uniref:Uncharacterized protein n=1 Tax=Arctium lappa TaxID=4217 RepID=A0ACB9FLQ9_ARCLA|nr:hypothetical protein L6452_02905 [Arctium lappa]